MGVTGLLQQLKEIQQKQSLSSYKGKTLAVDTYGWLHRGLISCAQDLCTDVPTRGYVTSVMKKVDMLRHFGVEPYMVFDGSSLPTKEGTHVERRQKREKAREAAAQALQRGDRKTAWKEFMKAAEVTPEMAKSVMVELDRKHVKYVVAPYEADPQMVFLEKIGEVDGILSEDSDLLVFGCQKLITKLNDYGECVEISRADLHKVAKLALHTYTPAQWRLVAILSGCDYTKGVPGVGLKTAFSIVSKVSSLDKIVLALRADKKTVPEEFMEEALRADLAFQFQKVFDPIQNMSTTLCEIPSDLGVDRDFLELCCGRTLDEPVHEGISKGRLHPRSHKALISREQNLKLVRSVSYSASVAEPVSSVGEAKSKSFSGAKSIGDYFKAAAQPMKVPKRENQNPAKLSPTGKKLKRVQVAFDRKDTTHSKFFSSLNTVPSLPKPEPDSSFLTGESEVSSSPVRDEHFSENTQYLTDDDEEFGKHSVLDSVVLSSSTSLSSVKSAGLRDVSDEEGYHNELEESPEKRTQVAQSWRERFSMGSKIQLQKTQAVKVVQQRSASSTESSSYPTTPPATFSRAPKPKDICPSSDRNYLSESEEETPDVLPKRTLKLSRFAFNG